MTNEIATLKKVFMEKYKIDISQYSQTFLVNVGKKKSRELGCLFLNQYWKHIMSNESNAMSYYKALSIDYSDFFRDPFTFGILEKKILPNLVLSKGNGGVIKIWSAGCSTGQEPYSIAIILNELTKEMNNNVTFQIFATDKDIKALEKARLGYYDSNQVGNLKKKYLDTYFECKGDSYKICDEIKSYIEFTENDLMNEKSFFPKNNILGNFDLILCNNVLFYYKLDNQCQVVRRFEASLKKGGYLILGEVEYMSCVDVLKIKPVQGMPGIFS